MNNSESGFLSTPQITKFEIIEVGDPTVGLMEQRWQLTGDFVSLDLGSSKIDEFREALADAFEIITGERVVVEVHLTPNENDQENED